MDEEEVLEATLFWGSTLVERVTVPTWEPVRIADLFAVPDELAARTIDFGSRPMLGERKMVTWGSLGVVIEVAYMTAPPPRAKAERSLAWALAAAGVLHVLAFGAAQSFPRESDEITADRIAELRARIPLTDDDEGGSGAMGVTPRPAEEHAATEGRFAGALAGPRARALGRKQGANVAPSAALDPRTFGLAAQLSGLHVGETGFAGATRGGALFGGDDLGGLEGAGLALSGAGEGSGGSGKGVDVDEGALGLGLGGAGGSCDDTCMASRLGRVGVIGGHGQLGPGHATRVPTLRCPPDDGCVTATTGRVPPEAIQRVVRANQGRFRLCYERGLVANPSLGGTVGVAFLIGRGGDVVAAKESAPNGEATLPDASVRACIVSTFQTLTFPDPGLAPVSVVYPMQLSPE